MTEIKLWNMSEGQPKQVLINNTVYDVRENNHKMKEIQPKLVKRYRKRKGDPMPRFTGGPVKGLSVTIIGHTRIWSNVLTEFREALQKGHSTKRIIRKYHPVAKASTVKAYDSAYKRYLRETEGLVRG